MRIKLISSVVFAIGMLFLIYSSSGFESSAQTAPSTASTRQSSLSRLSLQLEAEKTSYLLLEPISIDLTLVNNTVETIKSNVVLGLGPSARLLVLRPDGQEVEIKGSQINRAYVVANPIVLVSGQSRRVSELIDESTENIFPVAGVYRIKVVFSDESGQTLSSNSLQIEIAQPRGASLQAYQYLKNVLIPAKGTKKIEDITQLQKNFVSTYSNTPYWKFVIVKLASNYNSLGNYISAEKELCKVAGLSFFFSSKVRKDLDKINSRIRPVRLDPNLSETADLPPLPRPCSAL